MSRGKPTFVDLFSGCGGLSLGLMMAGWKGLFAIEKSVDAFKTLRHNLIDKNRHNLHCQRFSWPDWLELGPQEISDFLKEYRDQLQSMRGKVTLVAGGPPCQGFSFAGKRKQNDPRNELFKYYLEIVDILKPSLVLMENVKGIDVAFRDNDTVTKRQKRGGKGSHASRISEILTKHGYNVQQHVIRAVEFGVPQFRPRYITLGVRQDLISQDTQIALDKELESAKETFLQGHGLPTNKAVTVKDAISDLATSGKRLITCMDQESHGDFKEILYKGPLTSYQKLMHGGMNGQAPNSLRLPNHRPETILHFTHILQTCRKGVQLSKEDRDRLGIKKHVVVPLSPHHPSHTLTTLPDDLLHYAEPRIHTVREHARLQSFPDWFEFRGKYTTGGERRRHECPRYTQVGNAVPPLLAEAIGVVLMTILKRSGSS